MRVKFNGKTAEKDVEKLGRGSFYDETVGGLMLRCRGPQDDPTKVTSRSWALAFRGFDTDENGNDIRPMRLLTLGRFPENSVVDAREWAKDQKALLQHDQDPYLLKKTARGRTAEKARGATFGQLAAKFLKLAEKTKKSWVEDKRMLNKTILPKWKTWPAKSVTRQDVIDLLEELEETQHYHNRVRGLVSKIFNFGISKNIIENNPVHLTFRFPEKPSQRVATDDEIREVWARGIPAHQFILATGQRPRKECRQMKEADVDFAARIWTVKDTKNEDIQRVPLTDLAIEILRSQPPRRAGRIFQEKHQKVGVSDIIPQDLRRTVSTRMKILGISDGDIDRVLNHVPQGVTNRHYIVYGFDKEKREALELWTAELQRILKNGEEENPEDLPFAEAFRRMEEERERRIAEMKKMGAKE